MNTFPTLVTSKLSVESHFLLVDINDTAKCCYNAQGIYVGTAVAEGNLQWTFLPAGTAIYHDRDANLFVSFDSARQPISKSA